MHLSLVKVSYVARLPWNLLLLKVTSIQLKNRIQQLINEVEMVDSIRPRLACYLINLVVVLPYKVTLDSVQIQSLDRIIS